MSTFPSLIPGPPTAVIPTPSSSLPPSQVRIVPANTSTATPACMPSPPPLTLSCTLDQPSSPSPLRQAPLSQTPHSDHGDVDGWPPQCTPTWKLGPQHPLYVHAAKSYLIGVPGGPKWRSLLECWILYESLSSSNPVHVCYSCFSSLLMFILAGTRQATK